MIHDLLVAFKIIQKLFDLLLMFLAFLFGFLCLWLFSWPKISKRAATKSTGLLLLCIKWADLNVLSLLAFFKWASSSFFPLSNPHSLCYSSIFVYIYFFPTLEIYIYIYIFACVSFNFNYLSKILLMK